MKHNANLTTVLSFPERGPYGESNYRGNCSGYVQKSLFEFFQPKKVGDFMAGSNTTGDVCEELSINYLSRDSRYFRRVNFLRTSPSQYKSRTTKS